MILSRGSSKVGKILPLSPYFQALSQARLPFDVVAVQALAPFGGCLQQFCCAVKGSQLKWKNLSLLLNLCWLLFCQVYYNNKRGKLVLTRTTGSSTTVLSSTCGNVTRRYRVRYDDRTAQLRQNGVSVVLWALRQDMKHGRIDNRKSGRVKRETLAKKRWCAIELWYNLLVHCKLHLLDVLKQVEDERNDS